MKCQQNPYLCSYCVPTYEMSPNLVHFKKNIALLIYHYIKPKKHGNGTPIERHCLEYEVRSTRGKTQALRAQVVQFPMCLSWASTAHKMQVIKYFLN